MNTIHSDTVFVKFNQTANTGTVMLSVVRLNFVGTACLPFAPLGSCAGLVGKTIKNVLGSLKDSKNGFT